MTATPFIKFAWLKAVWADPRITDKEFRLATAICVELTRRDGTGWLADLDALASALRGGWSRNRLNASLRRLTEFGYLVETDRVGGGRGQTARRSHNLSFPAKPQPSAVRVWAETPTASGAGLAETRTASGSNPNRQRLKPQPPAVDEVSSDQREYLPTGTPSGTPSRGVSPESGTSLGGPQAPDDDPPPKQSAKNYGETPSAADDPEPPRFCPEHPNGTRESCPPCGDYRRRHAAWEARQRYRTRAEKDARATAITTCRRCDDYGQIDLGESVVICDHTPDMDRYIA